MSEQIEELDTEGYTQMEAGAVEKVKVQTINKGSQSEFRNDKYWDKSEMSKQEISEAKRSPCINVLTENGASLIINLPIERDKDGNLPLHVKSTMARFKTTYGSYPKVGMTVNTQLDQNGFWRIVLLEAGK